MTSLISGFMNPYLYVVVVSSVAYPPVGLLTGSTSTSTSTAAASPQTIAVSNQSYGNGVYQVSSSSVNSSAYYPTYAFDYLPSSSGQFVSGTNFSTSTKLYTGSAALGSFTGEWLQIRLPNYITLTSYSITGDGGTYVGQSAGAWKIIGSTDGTSWALIDSNNTTFTGTNVTQTFTVSGSTAYNYYAIVVTAVSATGFNLVCIPEFRLYGISGVTVTPLEYPPVALSNFSNSVSAAYGTGTYIVSASSYISGYYPYIAFNKSITGTDWASNGFYTLTSYSNTAVSTTVSGSSVLGEWIQLQLPNAITISSYKISSSAGNGGAWAATQWVVAGSTDGSTWTQIDTRSGQPHPSTSATTTYSGFSTPAAYQYYKFIIQRNGASSNDYSSFSEIYLYGV